MKINQLLENKILISCQAEIVDLDKIMLGMQIGMTNTENITFWGNLCFCEKEEFYYG
jgi:hypothetical protein